MRSLAVVLCLLAAGCAGSDAQTKSDPPPPAGHPAPTCGTRKAGSDWPGFLGPDRRQRLPEKGILAPWPKEGPRDRLAEAASAGYATADISRGRLFLFDRDRQPPGCSCWKSETGEPLWTFEYPTDYARPVTATAAARAAARSWTATASTSTAPRGCSTACASTDGKLRLEGGHQRGIRRRAELLRRRQHAGRRGRPADRPGRRQPEGERPRHDFDRTSRATAAASSPSTSSPARSRYRISDELASYAVPGAGDDRRPPLVLRLRPRRADRLRAGQPARSISTIPWRADDPGERQRHATPWWSATASSSPRRTAPAARC